MRFRRPGRRRGVRAGAPALVGVAVAALAACGGGSDAGTGAAAPAAASGPSGSSAEVTTAKAELTKYASATNSYPSVEPVSDVAAQRGKTVWYVPIGAAPPSLTAIGGGLEQALGKAGVKINVCDGKFLPTTIASCLAQAETQGADAVVTGYVDYALIPTAFDSLVAKRIPVLLGGASPIPGKTPNAQLAIYDTSAALNLAQKLSMDAVIADSDGKAKVLYVTVADSPQLKNVAEYGFKYLTDHCSRCSIIRSDISTASISKLPSQVSAALLSNSDTDYVVSEVDTNVPSILTGIQSAGYTSKVKLAASNGDLDALQRIKANTVQFVDPGLSTTYLGWQLADGMLRMLAGQAPKQTLTVARLFTKDNIAGLTLTPEAYATIDWYGSRDFEKTFMSAWGLA